MAEYAQTYETTIAAPPDACFAAITDFEAYPTWSSPIRSTTVLDRHPDGLARTVEFVLDMTLKTVRYVLEYAYEPPHTVRWALVEGDLASVEGSYRFEAAGNGTKATCAQSIELGFWVPSLIRSAFERKALRDSVEEFKRAVEARAQA